MTQPKVTCGDFDIQYIVTNPPFFENTFLVRHNPSGEQLLIDPGFADNRIIQQIEDDGDHLSAIWLTHGHLDHVGGVSKAMAAKAVECFAHENERDLISRAPQWASSMMGMDLAPIEGCHYYHDTKTMTFAGAEARVIETPGHTPGGVCYVFDGFAFTGDTIFQQGFGRVDLPGGDGDLLKASIDHFLAEVPDETLLFSGHGGHWSVGEAKQWWSYVRDAVSFV